MIKALIGVVTAMAMGAGQADAPQFTADNALVRPANYREWVWLSSGLGMSYAAAPGGEPTFDNVFVAPGAYREFVATGTWPEKTILILEERASMTQGSINKSGHFQAARMGYEAEVKDTSRFPGGWAFFNLSGGASSAPALPKSAPCYSCHAQHGAVDNTFVQFYPTLLEIAQAKGTLRASY
jgi:hypothetical protein